MSDMQPTSPKPGDRTAAEASEIDRLSPDPLLNRFSRPRTLSYLMLAVLVHALLIGGTSVGYIYDNFVDPEGAAIRRMEQAEAAKVPAVAPPSDAPAAAPPAPADGDPSSSSSADGQPSTDGEPTPAPPAAPVAPVIERITEMPAPGETPVDPFDDGILSIDDTN